MTIQGSAVFSKDRMYRHRLDRWWADQPRALICMANPSKAGADENDPTVHSIIRLVRSWYGCGGFTVVNYEPVIATDPNAMRTWQAGMARIDPEGLARVRAENLLLINRLSADAWIRIVAWGDIVPWPSKHSMDVLQAMSMNWTQDLYSLGLTKGGNPKHPLARGKSRIPDGQQPMLWRRYAEAA
jgi:hypothetical protein